MANIIVNEISQNYTYNIGNSAFATVALPITASWGPAYGKPGEAFSTTEVDQLESIRWEHFPSTQAGLESFVSTYRGPASVYRAAKDYSYQMAMTLLSSGYDVLVVRLCPGTKSAGQLLKVKFTDESTDKYFTIALTAKYPGTFGNNLKVRVYTGRFKNLDGDYSPYFNLITYVVDSSGVERAVENIVVSTNADDDTYTYYEEAESNFIDINSIEATSAPGQDESPSEFVRLSGGTDNATWGSTPGAIIPQILAAAMHRFDETHEYVKAIEALMVESTPVASSLPVDWATSYVNYVKKSNDEYVAASSSDTFAANTFYEVKVKDITKLKAAAYREWIFSSLTFTYDHTEATKGYKGTTGLYYLLTDKLSYRPQRIISPGWDDVDLTYFQKNQMYPDRCFGSTAVVSKVLSAIHITLMEVAYRSRCGTSMLDIPRSVPRKFVHAEINSTDVHYTEALADLTPVDATNTLESLYTSHSALFAPWGSYRYVGMNRQMDACPSFLVLLIQRAMILNQSLQYEWALPTNRKHNVPIGKLEYPVPKKYMDMWSRLEGVSLNAITSIPDLGVNIWGNSTLFKVPAATYQALANLSTRYLVNAVENVVYACGVAITFQYNNEQAYNKFYAGVTPTLDTMKNVGAIEDYYIKMAADIRGMDQVNANSVIGKIYLIVNGVINDITVDLVALPPNADLEQYKA